MNSLVLRPLYKQRFNNKVTFVVMFIQSAAILISIMKRFHPYFLKIPSIPTRHIPTCMTWANFALPLTTGAHSTKQTYFHSYKDCYVMFQQSCDKDDIVSKLRSSEYIMSFSNIQK